MTTGRARTFITVAAVAFVSPLVIASSCNEPTEEVDSVSGLTHVVAAESGALAWQRTAGATQYLVVVFGGGRAWHWEGEGNRVSIDTVTGGEHPARACWIVLASNGQDLLSASRPQTVGGDTSCVSP